MRKIFLFFTTILVTITLVGCVAGEPEQVIVEVEVDNLEFNLLGDNVVSNDINNEFVDPGFEATFGDLDLINEVTVTGEVNIGTPGTYFITYEIEHDDTTYSLLRAVVVEYSAVIPTVRHFEFELLGETIIELSVGSTFEDPGVHAMLVVIDGEPSTDYSDDVTINGTVDTETEGTYFIEYSYQHGPYTYNAIRVVHVYEVVVIPLEVTFELDANLVVELDEGDTYVEPGFTATIGDIDVSTDVVVTGTVDTSTPGIYYVDYSLTVEDIEYELTRAIVINEIYVAPDTLTYLLNNDVIIELTTAESYVEYGFRATFGDADISSNVTTTGTVDTSTPGTYFIEYTLDYDNDEISLLRAIVVTETTIVIDPDIVLAPNECTTVDIHYIDLDAMGDSTLIDCGDYEVLIDAGLKSTGSNVIVSYISTYVTDGIIELVIATHPDADHIGGFVGLSSSDGIFQAYEVEKVLDFGYVKSTTTTSQYIALRDSETSNSNAALVCSGDDALNSRNLCQPYYTIMDDLILRVIDTGHYDGEDTTNDNENSIVLLMEHGNNTFLFTGDAEHNSEAFMASSLPHVDVFKAGHHGSNTANGASLLASITPTDIILSVDFPDDEDGENGYGIPQQESLDRMFAHTDNIYATGVNGTIIVSSDGTTYTITGAINNTLLKDSIWFSTRRIYPSS